MKRPCTWESKTVWLVNHGRAVGRSTEEEEDDDEIAVLPISIADSDDTGILYG